MKELFDFYKSALTGGVIAPPLCAEYKGLWQRCHNDKEALLKLSLSQQAIPFVASYCYHGIGVTKDFIKMNFKNLINGHIIHDADKIEGYTYGMWVDAPQGKEIALKQDISTWLWCDETQVTIPQTLCPVIYVSNCSHIYINLGGYNNVRIYLFDESRVTIDEGDETSKCLIYKYSEQSKVDISKYCLSKVNVFTKQLRL